MFLVMRQDDEGELLVGVITEEEELLPLIIRDMMKRHIDAVEKERPYEHIDYQTMFAEVSKRVREQIEARRGYKMVRAG
jgi:hypothetical protein